MLEGHDSSVGQLSAAHPVVLFARTGCLTPARCDPGVQEADLKAYACPFHQQMCISRFSLHPFPFWSPACCGSL